MPRLRTLTVAFVALVVSFGYAQEIAYSVGFVDRDGAPLEEVDFGSGDVAFLHVEIRNESGATLEPNTFWVALPPAEGVRLIGNADTGYSFPDRMIGPDGEERTVDFDAPQDSTHLHTLAEPLAAGGRAALTVRVTVLSSSNGLGAYAEQVYLLDERERRIGTLVDGAARP